MKKEEIQAVLMERGLQANKKLGQNFLINDDLRSRIVREIKPLPGIDHILEVGPGLGSVTGLLLETGVKLTAVEIDSGFVSCLKENFSSYENFSLIHGDFLKTEVLGNFTKIFSNLPYYNASEMIFRFTEYTADEVFVMVQKEVAERIISAKNHPDYGALAVSLALYYSPAILFRAGGASFFPRPEVTSAFMRLRRKNNIGLSPAQREIFHRLVRSAFWGRRKTIFRSLSDSPHIELDSATVGQILEAAGLSFSLRAENLGTDDFMQMARELLKLQNNIQENRA